MYIILIYFSFFIIIPCTFPLLFRFFFFFLIKNEYKPKGVLSVTPYHWDASTLRTSLTNADVKITVALRETNFHDEKHTRYFFFLCKL